MGSKLTRRGRLLAIAGLLAGVGGGVGAARAAIAAHDNAAVNGDPFHVGALNDADADSDSSTSGITTPTSLVSSNTGAALSVRNVSPDGWHGIVANASNVGMSGTSGGIGVLGFGGNQTSAGSSATDDGGHGLLGVGGNSNGTDTAASGGDGVNATGGTSEASGLHGAGVRGIGGGVGPTMGPAVVGETMSDANPALVGINQGLNFGVYGASFGVGIRGVSFSASGAGVEGVAGGAGPGVWGFTNSGHAVLGNSTTGNGGVFAGKTGLTTTGSPVAIVAIGNVTATGTGHFGGGIVVSARAADGGLRATYGVTSPDAVVEDFGRARLVSGVARVELDPAYVALVGSADYAVFPVANGDSAALYIANKTATGFEIRESGGGTSTVVVDYRVVAKRSGVQSARFAHVDEPRPVSIPAMANVARSMDELAHLGRFVKGDRPHKTRGAEQTPRTSGGPPSPRRP